MAALTGLLTEDTVSWSDVEARCACLWPADSGTLLATRLA
jgi:hypothetical protein